MYRTLFMATFLVGLPIQDFFSQFFDTREELVYYTREWEGERFGDGRPMVGRAFTAQYMPRKPEPMDRLTEKGHQMGRVGAMNSWPIDALQQGDVYVADGFGKVVDGTLIGDNLGNAIYTNSGKGVVFFGGSRDMEGLSEIEGFNAFVKGFDPSYLKESMLMGINMPIRIGKATVFPGDVVLAKKSGVLFIPAHLAEEVVVRAEFIMLRDMFGHEMLRKDCP